MKSREEGFPLLRRSGANFASCCVPRGYAPMLAFSRGKNRAAPLPTHLLRICAGALKWHAPCAIPKLESGQSPTGGFAKKALSRPLPAKLANAIFTGTLFLNILLQAKPRFCAAGLNLPYA